MRRGEIRLVDLDPARGSEAAKRRPAVIVSNDGATTTATRFGRGIVTVVPVTSNVERMYPFQVLLAADECGMKTDSKSHAEQVRAVTVERIGDLVGQVPPTVMAEVDDALRLHLDL